MFEVTQDEIKKELEKYARKEKEYKEFSSSLIPGVKNLLGVRLPILRKYAKELAKKDYLTYLSWNKFDYFEEVMLQGMILGYCNCSIEEKLYFAEKFIPKIDNWSVNDSFCVSFTIAKDYPKEVWSFLEKYFASKKEYEIRMVAVMLLDHYLVDEYIIKVLDALKKMDVHQYYASMAVAWAYATAWAKYPKETKNFFKKNKIDKITYLRMLQKCIESRRINENDKKWMREERNRIKKKSEAIC